jgi:hypothetical protein
MTQFLIWLCGAYGFVDMSSPKAKRSTFIPGNWNFTIISLTSSVITPRSSAIIEISGICESRVLKKSSAGASTHLPLIAVFSDAFISQ